MRLPVPRHVAAASVVLGVASVILGVGYATVKVIRPPELEAQSILAVIEVPLGWVLAVAGLVVIVAAALRSARASAHTLAAVAHGAFLVALLLTYVNAYPLQAPQGPALALFGFVAHGGAALDYWQRGYR